jgi:RluA family pseudouridine synthase
MSLISKKFYKTKYIVKLLVDEEHEGLRLDLFMQQYLSSFSRQSVKKKIYDGEVVVEGRSSIPRPSIKVHHKDIVTLTVHKSIHEDEYWRDSKIDLVETPEIIFEDDDLLVVSKPPFMATHPTGKHLFNCATVFFENKLNHTIHSIHRLDRETSGVQLLGKNPKCANNLTPQFERGEVKKCYFFISKIDRTIHEQNKDIELEFEARERLGSVGEGLERVYVHSFLEDSLEGKHAKTYFKLLHVEEGYAIGLAFPQTGRQHQIRVHAMKHGFPLIGDKLYLGGYKMFQRFKDGVATEKDFDEMQIPRHALHAVGIKFSYQLKERIFIAPIPEDLKEWVRKNISRTSVSQLELAISKRIKDYFSQAL